MLDKIKGWWKDTPMKVEQNVVVKCCGKCEEVLEKILEVLKEILGSIQQTRDINFTIEENVMNVGQKQAYLVQETALGVVIPPNPTDTVTVVSSDPSVIVAPDATVAPGALASGFLLGMTVATGVIVTASAFKADGTAIGTPKTQTVDVTAVTPVADDINFTLGGVVSQ